MMVPMLDSWGLTEAGVGHLVASVVVAVVVAPGLARELAGGHR